MKLTDAKKRRLLRLVMLGTTTKRAAEAVGCTSRTVQRAAGRDEEFGWRLALARGVRAAGRESEREALAGSPSAGLACRLGRELRLAWEFEEFPTKKGDITAKSDAA